MKNGPRVFLLATGIIAVVLGGRLYPKSSTRYVGFSDPHTPEEELAASNMRKICRIRAGGYPEIIVKVGPGTYQVKCIQYKGRVI